MKASGLLFLAIFVFIGFFSVNVFADMEGSKEGASSPVAPQEKTIIRFERIERLNGKEMAAKVSAILQKHGWEHLAKKYDFSDLNIDGSYAEEKQKLFNAWQTGDGFEWVDATWINYNYNPLVIDIIHSCPKLSDMYLPNYLAKFARLPKKVRENEFYKKNMEFRSAPRDTRGILNFIIGPLAVYKLDARKLEGAAKDARYFVVEGFNNFPAKMIADGNPIEISKSISGSNFIYLIDANNCTYTTMGMRAGGYWGGYSDRSMPRLTGVGYYKGKIAYYQIYDVNADVPGNRVFGYVENFQGDLNFLSLSSEDGAEDRALDIVYKR